jgi:aspartate racemase
VSNTLHRLADRFTQGLGIPFLHIADPAGEAIRLKGLSRVALLGTKPVMATDHMKRLYADRFGIEIAVPETDEQDVIDHIIFEELCRGHFTSESRSTYLDIIDRLRERGAQGVILGCTEIPLLVDQKDRPSLPMFDTTGLHVAAVVRIALADSDS